MAGGMFAGHDQSGGELIEKDGKKYKLFYGMSSSTAMEVSLRVVRRRILFGSGSLRHRTTLIDFQKHAGGVANYRASEGKTVQLPYRGDLNATIQDILGGVRSTCTYVGAAKLKEISKRTTFIRVTQQVNNVFGAEKK